MLKPRLLIVEDNPTVRAQMRWAFRRDYDVLEAPDRPSALEVVRTVGPKVGIIDLGLPPSLSDSSEGLRTVREILEINPLFKAVIVTGLKGRENARRAVRAGAFDYFTKPIAVDEVRVTLKRAFHLSELQKEGMLNPSGTDAGVPFEIIGACATMQEVCHAIRKVADVNIPVLMLGEPGTGKELAAHAIHRLSSRNQRPFVTIGCGGIPNGLLETELFGYEKGAFEGADARKKGKIEYADGGALFLDEITELSGCLQARLLKFLQEHVIERFGGTEPVSVDARVISATSRDIRAMVKAGAFREDLYYRLGVISMTMPPLRERGEDIHMLALNFLKKYSSDFNRPVSGFDKMAVSALKSYGWPGNVRELENKVKRAVALCREKELTAADLALPSFVRARADTNAMSLSEAKDAFKKRLLQDTLAKNGWNITRSAHELGISRQYLSRLIARYDIRLNR